MPTKMNFEARSIEKALKKASKTLNLSPQDLKYEIVSYGSSGIFGLVGAKKARIQVVVPDKDVVENKEKSNKNSAIPKKRLVSENPLREKSEPAEEPQTDVLDSGGEDPLAVGREALQTILDAITSDARIVEISKNEDGVGLVFKVEGGNAAVLIGKRGQTLDAIQYMVEKIVNRKSEKRLRLQVDVEGYLENRQRNLENLALRLAQKSRKSGKPMTIGQLKPHERRIVHMALKENPDVRTQSMGDGYIRKLVIIPQKK